MRVRLCLVLGVASTLISGAGAAASAPKWSPDGRCVAWVSVSEGLETLPQPGWLFATGPGELSRPIGESDPKKSFRIEVVNVETFESWVVETSNSPLTAPEWGPSGRAMVFGRLDEKGTSFELVLIEGGEAARVLTHRPIRGREPGKPDTAEFMALGLSWSPDGRSIAFTMPTDPPELVVARADNGRVLKTIPGGSSPAWSPDGTRLAFLGGSGSRSILLVDSGMGGLKQLAEFSRVFQAPAWSRDGKSIQALVHLGSDAPRAGAGTIGLVRLPIDSGTFDTVISFPMDIDLIPGYANHRAPRSGGVSVATDRDGEELFTCQDLPGKPAIVVWSRPRNKETVARSHPLDFLVRVDGMSLSPGTRTLALHLGGESGVVALWDVTSRKLTPLVSDDLSRRAWLSLLIETCRQLSRKALPPAAVNGKAVERPTLLPVRGEVPWNHEFLNRLRHVAKFGRALCDRPATAPAVSPRFEGFLEEARLYFDYLSEDYPAALRGIERVEPRLTSPDDRLRLLSLRAQVEIALNDLEQANEVIAYLIAIEERVVSRIETTSTGVTLTRQTNPRQGWPRYLAHRAEDLAKGRKSNEPGDDGPDHPMPPPPNFGGGKFPGDRDLMPFGPGFRFVEPGMPNAPPPGRAPNALVPRRRKR
jgi:WD40-like Beta Propeller Repeat